jgi:hypothetical protein
MPYEGDGLVTEYVSTLLVALPGCSNLPTPSQDTCQEESSSIKDQQVGHMFRNNFQPCPEARRTVSPTS